MLSMHRRLSGQDFSLNALLTSDDEDSGERQDFLVDTRPSQEKVLGEREEWKGRMALLARALEILNERELRIFRHRRLRDVPATLEELSQEYGISRERVRQIEVEAFKKVQRCVVSATREQVCAAGAGVK